MLSYYLLPANSKVYLDVDGIKVATRARSSDMRVAIESLMREYSFLDDLLSRDYDGLVVDAGGYIGTAAIAFARRFPRARVITIEPSSDNFAVLEENIAAFPNIEARKAALGIEGGRDVALRDRGTGNWGFTIIEQPRDNAVASGIENVPLVSLQEIMDEKNSNIDFLKLDIEGGEKQILDAIPEVLERIPIVFIELHDRIVEGCHDSFLAFSRDRWVLRIGGEKFISIRKQR